MANTLRYRAVTFESETTEGVDVIDGSPATWYSTLGDGPRVHPVRAVVENNGVKAIHSGNPHQMFGSHADVNLSFELKGKSGAAGAAAVHGPILQACGFAETLNAATSSVYTLVTYHTPAVGAASATVYEQQYESSGQYRRYIATGVRGNASFNFTMDSYATLDLTGGMGKYVEPGTLATAAAPVAYDNDRANLLVRAIVLEIDSTEYCPRAIEFSTNWTVEADRRACGTSSLSAVRLVRGDGSRAGGTLTFSDPTLFAKILTAYGTDAQYALEITLTNGTDTLVVTGLIQFGMYERGGAAITEYSCPFFFVGDDGNDDIILTFT